MASKQVRKLESTTQNEVLEIEMAVRDRNGKKIDAEYATKNELSTAQTTLGGEIDANTSAISGLTTRVGNAEDDIDDLEAADTALGGRIDSEASTRSTADTALGGRIDSEATARADADTALGSRIDGVEGDIDDLEGDLSRIEAVAHGASRTFVLQATGLINGVGGNANSADNTLFGNDTDDIHARYYNDSNGDISVFYQVECPEGSLPDAYVAQHGLTANVVFIPEGLTSQVKEKILSDIPSKYSGWNVQLVEVRVGDNILVKEVGYPDRWFATDETAGGSWLLLKLEVTKVDLNNLQAKLNFDTTPNASHGTGYVVTSAGIANALAGKMANKTIDSSPTSGHTDNLVSSAGVATALAGKMANKTIDSEPTSGNTDHLISSAAVYTALQNMQTSLGLTSTVLGNVTIND